MTASRPGPHSTIKTLVCCLAAAAFVFCATPSPSLRAQPAAAPPPLASSFVAQPPNIGEAKTLATAYHNSGASPGASIW
jgi:hypothetical protein